MIYFLVYLLIAKIRFPSENSMLKKMHSWYVGIEILLQQSNCHQPTLRAPTELSDWLATLSNECAQFHANELSKFNWKHNLLTALLRRLSSLAVFKQVWIHVASLSQTGALGVGRSSTFVCRTTYNCTFCVQSCDGESIHKSSLGKPIGGLRNPQDGQAPNGEVKTPPD